MSKGRLEGGVKLAIKGANFTAYSFLGVSLGRTYVHSNVARIVELTYAELGKTLTDRVFVYGETGWRSGGRFRPHRSHQNGLSVDFFVPVVDRNGKSIPIPTSLTKRLGYDLEFSAEGKLGELTIDFVALAEHLFQLSQSVKKYNAAIALVIIDPQFLPRLFATPRGEQIRSLPFMKGKPWVRHDEHYHVDFSVPCEKLRQ